MWCLNVFWIPVDLLFSNFWVLFCRKLWFFPLWFPAESHPFGWSASCLSQHRGGPVDQFPKGAKRVQVDQLMYLIVLCRSQWTLDSLDLVLMWSDYVGFECHRFLSNSSWNLTNLGEAELTRKKRLAACSALGPRYFQTGLWQSKIQSLGLSQLRSTHRSCTQKKVNKLHSRIIFGYIWVII